MRAPLLAAAVCAVALALAAPAAADPVTEWNQNATGVLIGDNGQGAVANAHLAMVHGAVYDAVNAIDRRYEPFISAPRARRWYSQDAAAIAAAYRVLTSSEPPLVPSEQLPAAVAKLRPLYETALAAIPDGPAKEGGIATGIRAANAMIEARLNDGRFSSFRFPVGMDPGEWRPIGLVNDPGAWLKDVRPFLVRSSTQFSPRGPNLLHSSKYATDFNEVKALGSDGITTPTARTPAQTDAAKFWGLANGVGTWSAILRSLASGDGGSLADHARMFAMVYATTADAAITVWAAKARWLFWRPQTAIQLADTDGNEATVAAAGWTSLIPAPPYPEHPSGLSSLGDAAAAALADFYGTDNVAFTVTNAVATRDYASFSQAADEIVDARVWGGIHWRTSSEAVRTLGRRIAEYGLTHALQPAER
jgi:hypothetical protein